MKQLLERPTSQIPYPLKLAEKLRKVRLTWGNQNGSAEDYLILKGFVRFMLNSQYNLSTIDWAQFGLDIRNSQWEEGEAVVSSGSLKYGYSWK